QPQALKTISAQAALPETAREDWQDIIEKLWLPQPDPETRVIEQFDGYFRLEDIEPQALRKRLIHPEEYWGWPNGIAVHTQVLKQADIIQLLAMLDGFPQEVLTANYEYYEPRTEHGSSLSPSVHALVASKADHPEEAYRYFLESAGIDLYNASKKVMSGGSFLGGIHTAAAGGVWLIIVKGFAGLVLTENGASFKPALPSAWETLTFKIQIKGSLLDVQLDSSGIQIVSPASNPGRLYISVHGKEKWLNPGDRFTG
ncbi:glycosyl hydrolase family 65 protein, partial [Robiginitalea sp.]